MEDIVTVLAIFVGAPWAVFTGIAKVKAANAKQGAGLRMSELQALVEDAVVDATEPLRARIETLEAIAIDEDPTRRLDAALLADLEEPVGESVAPRCRTGI